MTFWLVLPIVVPMSTAVLGLLASSHPRIQRAISVAGLTLLLASTVGLFLDVLGPGIRTTRMGGWPAPFGVTLVADLLASVMVLLVGVLGFAVGLYAAVRAEPLEKVVGFHPLYALLLAGLCGAFLTGDLFNLYVWFEVMLVASFVLLAMGSSRAQLEGSLKYVTLNLVASTLLLSGVGVLYGMTGTLDMADLAERVAETPAGERGSFTVISSLFFVAFGIKAGVFPLFFWLPASYHTPSVAVSAIFAGLLTKLGFYALLRIYTLIFTHDPSFTHPLLLGIGALTMITGVLGAVAQVEVRRILSIHIISQIGYAVVGLGLFTPLALGGAVFYVVHVAIVKTSLFLIAGLILLLRGTNELKRLGGLYGERPPLAMLFLVSALSLAGIPPLSGFLAKLIIVRAAIDSGEYLIAGIALGVGMLTLLSMLKIWNEAFWKPEPALEGVGVASEGVRLWKWQAPVMVLATLTVGLSVAAGPIFGVMLRLGEQLRDPQVYVRAVKGDPE